MRERHNRNYPIPESIRLQNAFWAWERATWIVLAVILLIALTGLLAHGPLSKSTVTDGGLSLTYERFQRVTALARFNARILVSYGDEASLTLSPPFADNFQIPAMEPRPPPSTRGPHHSQTISRSPTWSRVRCEAAPDRKAWNSCFRRRPRANSRSCCGPTRARSDASI